MKSLRIQLDEKILESLDKLAEDLGMKTGSYIQMILGLHVKENQGEEKTD